MVGAIPRQPRRFWGVPDWQVSSANCANDRLLQGRRFIWSKAGSCCRGVSVGGSQDRLHCCGLIEGLKLAGTSGGYLDQPHLEPLPRTLS